MKMLLFALLCAGTVPAAHAQLWDQLKQTAPDAATSRVNQKAAEAANKAVDGASDAAVNKTKVVFKKKDGTRDKQKESTHDAPAPAEAPADTPAEYPRPAATGEPQGQKLVLKTNITYAVGKAKVEKVLRQQDGVFQVSTDTRTGRLTLYYSSDGTSKSSLVELITGMCFEADGAKATSGTTNACGGH